MRTITLDQFDFPAKARGTVVERKYYTNQGEEFSYKRSRDVTLSAKKQAENAIKLLKRIARCAVNKAPIFWLNPAGYIELLNPVEPSFKLELQPHLLPVRCYLDMNDREPFAIEVWINPLKL
jgi:hypothetical protein